MPNSQLPETACQKVRLPPLEAGWRWPRLVSSYLEEVEEECLKWSASFTAFDQETQCLIHEKGKLNLLAGMCYARMTKEQIRSGCELMHLFFMFDEYSDKASPEEVLYQAQVMIDTLKSPETPRPKGEWIGGEIIRQFLLHLPSTATETFRARFGATWIQYVHSVVQQAQFRSESRILDLEDFLAVRRHTSGAPSTIAFYEMNSDIPDDIREHPVIRELEVLAVDLIVIANDILSYNKEQAIGDDEHNIVTILMSQYNLDVQQGIDMAGDLADEKMNRFYYLYPQVPRYVGPVDLEVQTLVDGMAQCVSGVFHWSYESQRYFGKRGMEIKRTRQLRLLPKVKTNDFTVIASLPAGEYGTASAAGTAVTTLLSFPQVRFGLMVGIGAGVPRPGRDVRLGDIVVSRPEGTSGGVVQYDFGKALQGGEFRRTGFLNSPPRVLRSAVTNLQARHGLQEPQVPQYLDQMVSRFPRLGQPNNGGPSYTYQGIINDRLFNASYPHEGGDDCSNCDPTQLQRRVKRDSTSPVIHYGVITSGNMLIRDPKVRAEMVQRTGEDCICFEMEAAGLMNQFPCLVIRGICDYADSHKNDQWQRYAAATAAAYTKELIGLLPAQAVAETDTAAGVVNPGQNPTPTPTPVPTINPSPGQTTPAQTPNPGQSPSNGDIRQLRDDVAGLSRQMNTVIQMLQSSPPGNSGSGSGGAGSSGGASGGASGGSAPGEGTSGGPGGTHVSGNRWYGFALAEQVEAAQRRNPDRFRDDLISAIAYIGDTVFNWRADQNKSLDAGTLSDPSLVIHQQTLRPKTTSSTGPQITVTSAESPAGILPSRQIFPSDASSTPTILSPASSGQSITRPSLWDRAYDSLRKADERLYVYLTAVFGSYQLTCATCAGNGISQNTSIADEDLNNTTSMISTDSNERQKQLEDITKRGLQRVDEKQTRYMLFGHQFILKDQVVEAAKFVQNIKTLIDEAVKASPEASLAWAGVCILLPVLTSSSAAEEASRDGFIYVTFRIRYYMEFEHLLWPDSLHASNMKDTFETQIIDLYQHILEFQVKNVLRFYRNWLANVGRDISGSDDWKGMLTVIKDLELTMIRDWSNLNTAASRKALEAIDEATQQSCTDIQSLLSIARQHIQVSTEHLDVSSKHLKIHERTNQLLEDHPIDLLTVSQARYDSADVQDSPKCESGPAGTGKSTIARTVADVLNGEDRLVAGYFFKRGQQGRNGTARLFSTIAMQMMEKIPSMKEHLRRSLSGLDKDAIEGMALEFQFKKLILSPLAELPPDNMPRLATCSVIILDALDECENEDHLSRIITLFLQLQTLRTIRLRVLLTSRSSPEIRDAFMDLQKDRDFCNIELLDGRFSAETKSGIQTFLENNFADIRKKRRVQQNPWPTQEELDRLVELATTPEPLFIYAATLCRFVHGERRPKNPKEQLRIWLKQCDDRQSQLHQIYEPILNQVFSGLEPAEFDSRMEFLGSLVLLVDPMPAASLAALLQMDIDDVVWWLPELHAVLNIPAEDHIPVRLLHKSFSDFILSTERPGNSIYSIDTASTHTTLATKCLGHMNAMLKRDICNIKQLGKRRKDIDQHIVDKHITPDLKYACLYWIYHLQHEVLATLGRLSDAAMAIRRLLEIFQRLPDVPAELVLFTADASRFISSFGSIIDRVPLQIYAASLMFSPTSSKVRQNFWNECLVDIDSIEGVKSDWDVQWQTLEGHSEDITAFAFSPDSQTLASASEDGMIRLWDVTTGTHRQILIGHSKRVTEIFFSPDGSLFTEVKMEDDGLPRIDAVVFSPDGHLAASILTNNTIRIWDTRTGAYQQTLKDYNGLVTAVKFSPNNRLIALLLNDGSVQLWDIKVDDGTFYLWEVVTGSYDKVLKDHDAWAGTASFSPNGELVAYVTYGGTVRLWNVTKGTHQQELKLPEEITRHVVFSPNGQLVAATGHDIICVWDTVTGVCHQTLKGHSADITGIIFSPNNLLMASISHDETVRLWDITRSTRQQALEGHNDWITAVSISPNAQIIASASVDGTVQLWDAAAGAFRQTLDGPGELVSEVIFSYDSRQLVSLSMDQIRIWDAVTGVHQHALQGHSESMWTMVVSPHDKLATRGVGDDITIQLWDTVTGTHQLALEGHSKLITEAVFSPDGRLLVSASHDETVRVWDVLTGTHQQLLKSNGTFVSSIAFSPKSQLVALGFRNSTVQLWDLATSTHQQTFEGYTAFITAIAFSPDGKVMASALDDGTVCFCDTTTGKIRQTLKTGEVRSLRYDPASKMRLYTDVGTLVMNRTSMEEIADIQGLTPNLVFNGLSFSPDKEWIRIGFEDHVWLPSDYRQSVFGISTSIIRETS
ncbi:hypothetical protein M431DRAFT_19801 [Trichoderma harzianum CBS 226.95]|uniref:Mitochondrial division protein 1 n=1 Tax=Trichoderma harzianum CBS 226.95 TaxID=983964 RepID=A0A2T4A005_TRIHA|nr:hypothetical protein M431DRAFT_19801 [Trichoderma harzianum CBS 226.95]PTB50358.1 hypothetical protein M431DRAFT_19801 [Trichoderma harzianum CBS 226.95]